MLLWSLFATLWVTKNDITFCDQCTFYMSSSFSETIIKRGSLNKHKKTQRWNSELIMSFYFYSSFSSLLLWWLALDTCLCVNMLVCQHTCRQMCMHTHTPFDLAQGGMLHAITYACTSVVYVCSAGDIHTALIVVLESISFVVLFRGYFIARISDNWGSHTLVFAFSHLNTRPSRLYSLLGC